jgi:lysozyme family protein
MNPDNRFSPAPIDLPARDSRQIDRREFGQSIAGIAAVAALGLTPLTLSTDALAQRLPTLSDWTELSEIAKEARALGLPASTIGVPTAGSTEFGEILPPLVDLIDDLSEPAANSGTTAAAVAALKKRATTLLTSINAKERAPRKSDAGGASTIGWLAALGLITPAHAEPTEERYRRHRQSYIDLFDTCRVRPERQALVDWHVNTILKPANRARYEKLEDQVCVPWYFIGCIHALEASFNFEGHLHNGDSLSRKTVNVPAGRPETGTAPYDWFVSAKDALDFEKTSNQPDWSLPRMLCRLEGYNGFRSREIHGINSPYLWSFSNHYAKGKFVADDVFDKNAVSQQCGGALLIRELLDRRIVQIMA